MIGELSPRRGGHSKETRKPECHPDRKHESRGFCSPCYTRWRYEQDRERLIRVSRAANLRSQFGITQEEYDRRHDAQGGLCLICHKPCKSGRKLAVDHDHQSGRVRGLLCGNCNIGLGKFQDDPVLLIRASEYLANVPR